MIDVNKKILWLSDFDISQAPGGAQRSDKILIDSGILHGFNILKVNHETFSSIRSIHDFDVVISTNVCALSAKYKFLIDELYKHKYHVRLEHDSNAYLSQDQRIKLFGNCVKTIFLTDYHFSFFKQLYGNIFSNVEIVYDPIDVDLFYDKKEKRENKILYAGYMHTEKGSEEFFEYALRNQDKQFVIAGFTDQMIYHFLSTNIVNIEYLGLVNYENMPLIYNKYKEMFYSPKLREPFCRSVAEAICCGMNILTNAQSRIGCIQEIQKHGIQKFKEDCKNAAKTFWEKI